MSLLAPLLAPEMAPFGIAIGLVAGLLMLEILALLLGGSLFGADAHGHGFAHDPAADMDVGLGDTDAGADLGVAAPGGAAPGGAAPGGADPGGAGLHGQGADVGGHADAGHADAGHAGAGHAGAGVLSWLGLGEVPFIIWLAGMLTAFGLTGYALQTVLAALTGGMLPAAPAAFAALIPALWAGRRVARGIGRLVPKTHSEAVSQRHLGGRTGVIATGAAATGRPAQARVTDRYGNIQYLRVEPFKPGQVIPEGTEIAVLWGKGPVYQAVPLDEIEDVNAISKE